MYPTRPLYSETYRNVSWCLLVEAYLLRANAVMRRSNSNIAIITLFGRTRKYLTIALVIGPPYS